MYLMFLLSLVVMLWPGLDLFMGKAGYKSNEINLKNKNHCFGYRKKSIQLRDN